MTDNFIHFYQRHLEKLKEEIETYPDEKSVWTVAPGITNSGGILACHLVGNLNHFIGHVLGGTDYVRDRPLEFSKQDLSRKEIVQSIDDVSELVKNVLEKVEDLSAPFPSGYFPWENNIHYVLLQLLWHLTYHLGQVNYHRRLLT